MKNKLLIFALFAMMRVLFGGDQISGDSICLEEEHRYIYGEEFMIMPNQYQMDMFSSPDKDLKSLLQEQNLPSIFALKKLQKK